MHELAIIPGDGIGKEVTAEAVKVLKRGRRALRPALRSRAPALERRLLPRDRHHDSAGRLRHAAAVRRDLHRRARRSARARQPPRARHPARHALRAGSLRQLPAGEAARRAAVPAEGPRPGDVDFVVFRENTEGLYVSIGGRFKAGTEDEIAIQEELNTLKGVNRIIRHAFEFAQTRRPDQVSHGRQEQRHAARPRALAARVQARSASEYPGDRGHALLHRRAGDVHGPRPRRSSR